MVASATPRAAPGVTEARWGSADGKEVSLYTLSNGNGLTLKVSNYGGVICSFEVPDRRGELADVVLGFDDLASYVAQSSYFGAVIGRVANRIAGARFTLQGKTYRLAANNGESSLHGGNRGWDKAVWQAKVVGSGHGPSLELTHESPDGDEGFPGTVQASNTYTLDDSNVLTIEMRATTDQVTVINMAHHSYWNLAGHAAGSIRDHELAIHARRYTPADPQSLTVSGEVVPVSGTPFDFTVAKAIGADLGAAGGQPVGFDTNWIVDGAAGSLRPVARAKDPASGRVLSLMANQPGVQFYSGNFLDGSITGKASARYDQYAGFCLETQAFPNAINVPAWRNSVLLEPGQTYSSTMRIAFTTE